jgi:hypothetical protein
MTKLKSFGSKYIFSGAPPKNFLVWRADFFAPSGEFFGPQG